MPLSNPGPELNIQGLEPLLEVLLLEETTLLQAYFQTSPNQVSADSQMPGVREITSLYKSHLDQLAQGMQCTGAPQALHPSNHQAAGQCRPSQKVLFLPIVAGHR